MTKTASFPLFLQPQTRQDGPDTDKRILGINFVGLKEVFTRSISQAQEPLSLCFNIEPDLAPILSTDHIETIRDGGIAWSGSLPGNPDIRAYLGIADLGKDGSVAVCGRLSANERQFSIRTLPGNQVAVIESVMPASHCAEPLPARTDSKAWLWPQTSTSLTTIDDEKSGDIAFLEESADNPAVIEVLACYPLATLKAVPTGRAGILAMLSEAQRYINDAFRNSGIQALVQIVGAEQVDAFENSDVVSMLHEVAVVSNLSPLMFKRGAAWQAISQARDSAGADVVVVLAPHGTRKGEGLAVGMASCIPEPPSPDHDALDYAVFCIALDQDDTASTFAHELGHLLGGKHDRATQPVRAGGDPKFDFAHGYVCPAPPFVTLMGYATDLVPLVPAYSAADRTWKGAPLGIPLGKPEAADCALLFRQSARVVAGYRGTDSPRWEPVALTITVAPALGGIVEPSAFGPHPKGSVVTAIARARIGYAFDKWLLDGKVVTQAPKLSVSMDQPHELVAQFVQTNGSGVELKGLGKRSGGTVSASPPGPVFPVGSEVTVSWQSDQTASSRSNYYWALDQKEIMPVKMGALSFIMEGPRQIDVIGNQLYIRPVGISDPFALASNTSDRLVIEVSDAYSGVPHLEIDVALIEAPIGTTLATNPRFVTDFAGRISIPINVGMLKSSTTEILKIRLTCLDRPGKDWYIQVPVEQRRIRCRNPEDLVLLENEQAQPIQLELLEGGHGVEDDLKADYTTSTTGLKPKSTLKHTDAHGLTTFEFSGAAKVGRMLAMYWCPKWGTSPSLLVQYHIISQRPEVHLLGRPRVKVGIQPLPIQFQASEDVSLGSITLPPLDVSLSVQDPNPTGVSLLESKVPLDPVGRGWIFFSTPKSPGILQLQIRIGRCDAQVVMIEVES